MLGSACLHAAHNKKIKAAVVPASATTAAGPALFASVDDAFLALQDNNSPLQWEASHHLRAHPAEAIGRLEQMIVEKHSSWFIAMCTLTDIGGSEVVRFYCDLLDKNRHEMDETGKRRIYGLGSPLGCVRPLYVYGEAIVAQLGALRDPSADPCLRRAWLDGDSAVSAAVPKARYEIGALSLRELQQLAVTDEKHRAVYFHALEGIAYGHIHDRTDLAIELFEWMLATPASGQETREIAHTALIQCCELKKDYAKALEHCDWVIENAATAEMSRRRQTERPELLYLQGRLTTDDFFALAKKDPAFYERIAQRLGRMGRDVGIFDRIIKEAPAGSRYAEEAEYWKLEYFDEARMRDRAGAQARFILGTCKDETVLNWTRRRMAKEAAVQKQANPWEAGR
ncbi:MAG: hypothetical protein K0R17_1705 [Rariglobus sp.]|jgi:hypothetical protein|nr:hypothetical protein [Rariglobus sp.]